MKLNISFLSSAGHVGMLEDTNNWLALCHLGTRSNRNSIGIITRVYVSIKGVQCFFLFLLTVVLLQQLYSGEQYGSVLRISDVQLIQVLLLQQLERVQVLVAVEQESGHVLLQDRNVTSGFKVSFEKLRVMESKERLQNTLD